MEQVLSQLPDEWKYQKLKTLIKMHYGKALKAVDRIQGDVPVYGSNGVVGSHNEHLWSQPTVVIGRKGSVGEANLALTPSWTIDTAYYIEIIDQEVLDLMYFYHFADRFDVSSISQKGVKPGINRNDYLNLSFPLPPLNEQKRIVEKLDALLSRIDTAIEHLQESVTLADALYASELNEVFPSDADIESLSDKAGWVSLSDICTFENGDRGKNYPSKSAFVAEGIPVVSAGNLGERYIDHKGLNYITPERYELLRSGRIRMGDILFCLRGSLGKVAISKDINEGVIASSLVIIRPKDQVSAKYIYKYLKSSLCQKFISYYNNGAAQPNLSAKSLGKFMLPLPNADQQKVIVDALDEKYQLNQKLLDGLNSKIISLQSLKASILDSAFKGEL